MGTQHAFRAIAIQLAHTVALAALQMDNVVAGPSSRDASVINANLDFMDFQIVKGASVIQQEPDLDQLELTAALLVM